MAEKIAVAVLWRGPELIIEERWEDMPNGLQQTRYAFPGGKVEATDKNAAYAAAREISEEVGVDLDPEGLKSPEVISVGDEVGYFFQVRLPYGTKINAEDIIIWSFKDLIDHYKRGKLMPLTNEYVSIYF